MQYKINPEKGYKVEYILTSSMDFRLFPIDQHSDTAISLKLSKDQNRLSMFLGAPGDGLSYNLIKYDPTNPTLIELHNLY
jgi:hypothetical protein